MVLNYKKATIDDLDVLIETRIQVLRAANHLSDDVHIYGFIKMNDEMELANI